MGESSLLPVQLFKPGANEEKSETARLSTFVGAIVIGELVQTTLGPKGMDKILQSPNPNDPLQVTNDGATILKSIGVDNPVAKILVDVSQKQDSEVGDGTTSVVLLTSELLREAEILINKKIHPQTIISGWRSALETAKSALFASSFDNSGLSNNFREDLLKIAKTTLSSKVLSFHKQYFAELAVNAVLRLKESGNLESIQIIKKLGGTLRNSFLDEGFILDKKVGVSQPKRIEDATILIANTPMDTDKIKVFGSRIKVDSIAKVAELEVAEKQKMKEKVEKILAHGAKVFINRQLIYNYPEQLFSDAGVMAIEHADFEGVERLALATGADIVSTFDNPELVKLGKCKVIEEVVIGEDRMLRFSGLSKGEACTIVIRGATNQIIDEAERSLHDALCVLVTTVKDARVVYGGGCSEILMSNSVSDLANNTTGKEAVAIESFANALKIIPSVIADNGGYDSMELLHQLRAYHRQGRHSYGLDMENGCVGDMNSLGIFESLAVKWCVLFSAVETAEMILRVDHVIHAAPRQRTKDHRH